MKYIKLPNSAIMQLGAIAIISLTACNNHVGAGSNNNPLALGQQASEKQYLNSNMEIPVHMGYGLDNRTDMPKGVNCMANKDVPNAVTISNQTSHIDFSSTTSASTIADMMNVGISGKASFGLYSASVSAQYARSSTDSRQSLHFNYLQTMSADATYKVPGVGNNALSADAQSLLNNGGGLALFHKVCGNSFIQSANKGALLLVDVSIEFANAASKEKFSESINVKAMGIGGITQAFDKERTKSTSGASITVKALQLGGDATKLANAFGKPGPDGNYNVKKCTMQDVNSCANMINDIINYARNDFATSVNFKDAESLYTFATNEMLYEDLGIQAHLPDLTPAEQEANQYLNDTITHDRTMLQYLQAYQRQNMMSKVDPITKDWLRKATEQYEDMIKEYDNYNIINSCYGDTTNLDKLCVDAENHVKDLHKKYQQYIDFANMMANTIVVATSAQYKFIPSNAGDHCTKTQNGTECTGYYFIYTGSGDLAENWVAAIDTSKNSDWFNQYYPQLVGTSYLSWGPDGSRDTYIKRMPNGNLTQGIAGNFVNGYPKDAPVNAQGYNTNYYYSDSSDLLYNPI